MLAADAFDEAALWANLPVIEPYDLSGHPEMQALIDYWHSTAPDSLEALQAMSELSAEDQAALMAYIESHRNHDLAAPDPELAEELMRAQAEYWSQDQRLRNMAEFALILSRERHFSNLPEEEQVFIFRQLDIAYDARSITTQLFQY